MNMPVERGSLELADGQRVAALFSRPETATTCLVLAHGAGAGMTHAFMAAAAAGLFERGIATLRFQFPFMERGSKRPDPPAVAHGTVRAAVAEAARRMPEAALFAGGKSFGGRMAAQAQASAPLPGVRGLVFLGFPLHPAGRPSTDRAAHLPDIHIPMLFLQGTRDKLAEMPLLAPIVDRLPAATLVRLDEADHAFHVPVRSGRSDEAVLGEMLDHAAAWMRAHGG